MKNLAPSDSAILQSALDAGGVINLAPGVYECPAGLAAWRSGTKLRGEGYASVSIHAPFCNVRPNNKLTQVEDMELSGFVLDGGQALLDLITFSKVDIQIANSPDWALKITCTGERPDLDTDINDISVVMHDCAKGGWIGQESTIGSKVDPCHNRLMLCTYNIAGVSLHLADCDNNEFLRTLIFDGGVIEIETDKAYSNSFMHLQSGVKLLNTSKPQSSLKLHSRFSALGVVVDNPPYMKNLIWHYDKANGQPDPICDGPAPAEEFLTWLDSSGNLHGTALPHFHVPGGLNPANFPRMPDRNWFTFYDDGGTEGFGMGVRENKNPWAARMKYGT